MAMYAIDSLRQLGMKYLERAELTNFTFQNDILKPFVVLMRNSQSERIRGLIVDCIVQVDFFCFKHFSTFAGVLVIFNYLSMDTDDKIKSWKHQIGLAKCVHDLHSCC